MLAEVAPLHLRRDVFIPPILLPRPVSSIDAGVAVGVAVAVAVAVGVGVGVGVTPGSNVSAVARMPSLFFPPATSTLPSGSDVAVYRHRALLRLPVTVQFPVAGSYISASAKEHWLPARLTATSA